MTIGVAPSTNFSYWSIFGINFGFFAKFCVDSSVGRFNVELLGKSSDLSGF
jgi:hypothetical protein